MKYIFEDLIEIEEIHIRIKQLSENEVDQLYLLALVKDTMHHKIADMILDHLDEAKKLEFLSYIDMEEEHPNVLKMLSENIENLEYKIIVQAKNAENEILNLISKT